MNATLCYVGKLHYVLPLRDSHSVGNTEQWGLQQQNLTGNKASMSINNIPDIKVPSEI